MKSRRQCYIYIVIAPYEFDIFQVLKSERIFVGNYTAQNMIGLITDKNPRLRVEQIALDIVEPRVLKLQVPLEFSGVDSGVDSNFSAISLDLTNISSSLESRV